MVHFSTRIWYTFQSVYTRDKASSVDLIVEKNANYEGNVGFLQKLAQNNYIKLEDVDYIKLREKPLLQLDEVTYRIIHPLFLSDKIYKGIYFLLNQLNSQEPKVIKSFRSWYTSNFSEDVCFRKVIEYAIPRFSARFFDKDLKEMGIVGPPDCYLRIDTNLFLFENKDILINATIKGGYDFEAVIKELKKKLYEEEGRPVGIGQIIANIRKLLTKENTFDKTLLVEQTIIYPILIIHDYMFDTPGLNRIMNIFFQEELAKLKAAGLDVSRVKPLSIVNIDSLILTASLLRNGKTTILELLDAFLSNTEFPKKEKYSSTEEYSQDYQNSLLSFSNYIGHFLIKKFGSAWRSEEFMQCLYEKIK